MQLALARASKLLKANLHSRGKTVLVFQHSPITERIMWNGFLGLSKPGEFFVILREAFDIHGAVAAFGPASVSDRCAPSTTGCAWPDHRMFLIKASQLRMKRNSGTKPASLLGASCVRYVRAATCTKAMALLKAACLNTWHRTWACSLLMADLLGLARVKITCTTCKPHLHGRWMQ